MNALRLIGISIVVVAWISAPAAADSRCKALHDALFTQDTSSLIASALRQGADINCRDDNGLTALMVAASGPGPDLAAVRTLLRHGADVNARDDQGTTALGWADMMGGMVEMFPPAKGDQKGLRSYNEMMQAYDEVIRVLLRAGGKK